MLDTQKTGEEGSGCGLKGWWVPYTILTKGMDLPTTTLRLFTAHAYPDNKIIQQENS